MHIVSDTQDIQEEIYRHLEKFNPQGIVLTPETDLQSDLNIDSAATLELVFDLEERFDVSIPLEELSDITTVAQLAALIQNIKGKAA